MLAYYFHSLDPFIFKIGSVGPRWYGLSYVLAFLFGFLLYRWLARRGYTDMPEEKVADFITYCAIFGVMIGGRLGWIIFYGFFEQVHEPRPWWWFLEVWKGGMSSHGGILGLVLFTLYFARRHRLSWTSIGDSLCVVACIGLLLVRCANFINAELIGRPAEVPWAVQFPTELIERATPELEARAYAAVEPHLDLVMRYGPPESSFSARVVEAARAEPPVREALRPVLTPRHPSQLYEALLEGVVLFAALWIMRTQMRVPRGVITGAFFILYATLRIIGEIFREPDPAWQVGPISAGQFLSIFFYAIGAVFIAWGLRTQQYERAVAPAVAAGEQGR